MGKESMQNRKPMILVLAGPNGSGKSTITTFFDKCGKPPAYNTYATMPTTNLPIYGLFLSSKC